MPKDEGAEGIIRKLLPFTTVLLVILVLYVGWIFWSRHSEAKELRERQAATEAANAQASVDAYGGDRVKILSLSLNEGTIHRGKSTQLCYGVSNAKSVKIDPVPDTQVWPSMSRCFDVSPKKDTLFTLTAKDAAGHTETAQVNLFVR